MKAMEAASVPSPLMRRMPLLVPLIVTVTVTAAADLPPLISREALLGAGGRFAPKLSPDGKRLSWLAPNAEGVVNVWVQTIGKDDARVVTGERHRPLYAYEWAPNGEAILYFQNSGGDETDHLFLADLDGKNVRDLTPLRGVEARNLMVSPSRPNEVLIALNARDRRFFDAWRADLETGAMRMAAQNPGDVTSWTADAQLQVRAATAFDAATARTVVRVRDTADGPWRELIGWPFERAPVWYGQMDFGTMVLGFTPDGKALHVLSGAQSDTLQVVRIDVASGRVLEVVASDARSDVMDTSLGAPTYLAHPRTNALQAVAYGYAQPEWKYVDPSIREDFARIGKEVPGFIRIRSRDVADTKWIVFDVRSDKPPTYYLYDRAGRTVTKLFDPAPALATATLVAKKFVTIRARDGVELPAYLSLPAGIPARNLPMIVTSQGGPWQRFGAEYDAWSQFFANRGYAYLEVNHRGASGFGLRFTNLMNGEWSGKAIDDIADAVRWATREGIADPARVGGFGSSGGGYGVLMTMARYPELIAAGASLVAPTEIRNLVSGMPPHWAPNRVRWLRRIGNVLDDPEVNRRVSPLYHAAKIKAPLMMIEGANDPRVSGAEEFVQQVRKHNSNVTFLVYTDEGHELARHENLLDFFGRLETFFARHLGGRAEPMKKIDGASGDLR
jgi:dipeptidyl aminopeptidase/acylaminoacyl peptidase